jgi:N-acetyl-anhydromuramyl-L-alanine amidase AmpD
MAPRPEVTVSVRNQSSRNGVKPRIIVLHSTESHERPGVEDLVGLGRWFDNPAAQASSHVANDGEGNDARYVPDERKAWTQAGANSYALSIEQIGFARETREEWLKQPGQLNNTARWIAYWSSKYDIPIVESTEHGVCQHSDLGAMGGGHHDCGPGYPLDIVLKLAKTYRKPLTKEQKWARSLRILRAKAAANGWKPPYRVRARRLKKLLARP